MKYSRICFIAFISAVFFSFANVLQENRHLRNSATPLAPIKGLPCDSHLSAVIDCISAGPRLFIVPICNQSFTVPGLLEDFSAHQVEWSMMGKTKAFWSVLVDLPQDDNQVTPSLREKFYARGALDVKEVITQTRERYSDWNLVGDVLDFGCGLGRLSAAIAQVQGVRSVACVDQSVYHLEKAKMFTEALPIKARFSTVVSGPDLLMALQQGPQFPKCFDFVNSLIAFQHMITPLQAVYLEQLCDVLKPGGIMRVQLPSKTALEPACDERLRKRYRDAGGMQMHHIDEGSVRSILAKRGCDTTVEDIGSAWVGGEQRSMMVYARKRIDHWQPCFA